MFFVKRDNAYRRIAVDVTKAYLSFLYDNEDTEIGVLLDNNPEKIVELFRHSLCEVLDLQSTLGFDIGETAVKCTCNCIRSSIPCIGFRSVAEKQGFVEACVHCIVATRNRYRGASYVG